jgi:uncharacterized membrane protein
MSAGIAPPPAKGPRIDSVDFLRGLVIVVMALDHVRDYVTSVRFDPLDLTQTNAALFLTRWITHFCAPVFVFLAGTSAGLQAAAGKTKSELARFLLTRGLWLIFLELTVIYFGWTFNFTPSAFLQVIWAIGVSMIVLAGLIFLPIPAIAAVAAILILGHNAFDAVSAPQFAAPTTGAGPVAWMFLHHMGFTQAGPVAVFVAYPLVPWVGVMALGYVFAGLYRMGEAERGTLLVRAGLVAFAAFAALRGFNIYGDPQPWSAQSGALKTALSFVNTSKYPPSLLFLLMTLGPSLIVLAFAERWRGAIHDFFVAFGRVPLFFYVIHIYLAHAAAAALAVGQGFPAQSLFVHFLFLPQGYGYGLGVVYLVWFAVVAALYPACVWFGRVKKRSRAWWMSYF